VMKEVAGVMYVASSTSTSSTKGVFGMVSQTMTPFVWVAGCSGNTCDAATASSGPPAGGSYASGTTAVPVGSPTISYASGVFSSSSSAQVLTPTVTGSPTSYAYTGTLPSGVTFSTTTGAFTGPVAWNAPVLQSASGVRHTCALSSPGSVKCWGENSGKLGNGSSTNSLTPVQVTGLTSGVTQVAMGTHHTCAIISTGGVQCWGSNSMGQLGDGTTSTRTSPVQVSGLTSGVTQISAGEYHTCALLSNASMKCWGYNADGAVGDGTTTNRSTPQQVSGLTSGVTHIGAGSYHTCATVSGAAKCWGSNFMGQVGDGTIGAAYNRTVPTQVYGLTSGVAQTVGAGNRYSCAVMLIGTVQCWGENGGQLGDGTYADRLTPVPVAGITSGVTSVVPIENSACVLFDTGGVKCWGSNYYGQIGDGTNTDRLSPTQVSGLTSGVTQLSGRGGTLCAVLQSTALTCWGGNFFGHLANGTTNNSSSPMTPQGHAGNVGVPATVAVTATNASGTSAAVNVTLVVS
jgi:alpha-tubulin suppressor-like RCC1 family protein